MAKQQFWDGTRWIDESPQAPSREPSAAATVTRHVTGRLSEAMVIVGIVTALAFTSALFIGHPLGAGMTRAAGSGSITVPNGVFGGTTTATVHTGPTTWVHAACYQGGAMVYEQYVKADSYNHAVLTLGPTPFWPSGAASCTAAEGTWMSSGKFKVSATTTFSVSG